MKATKSCIRLGLALIPAAVLLLVMTLTVRSSTPAHANSSILYVSANDPTCAGHIPCYTNLQDAVNGALDDDMILVATGVYTDPDTASLFYFVHITKSVMLQGGWDPTFVEYDPSLYPTVLSAEGKGQVIRIEGEVSPIRPKIEGFVIRDGDGSHYLGRAGCHYSPAYCGGGIYSYDASPILVGNIISGNVASANPDDMGIGGGVFLYNPSTQMSATLRANTIQGNIAQAAAETTRDGWGGGVYLGGFMDNSILEGNTIVANHGATNGGGVYLEGSVGTVFRDNVIASNQATGKGAGVYVPGSGSLRFEHNTFTDNVIQGYENTGAGCYLDYVVDFYFEGNRFEENDGGGLRGVGSPFAVTNNIFARNGGRGLYLGGTGQVTGNRLTGSGAYLSGDITFRDNEVLSSTNSGIDINSGTVLVEGNLISGNLSSWRGGGVLVQGGNVSLRYNVITHNEASLGGGLYIASNSELIHNTITSNTADTGGGFYLNYVNGVTIHDNLLSGNKALGSGGGLYMRHTSPFDFYDNTIIQNRAMLGGGLYVEYNISPGLYTSLIADNEAAIGGGIYLYDCDNAIVSGNIISGNQATDLGGGFYQERGKNVRIIDNTFSSNAANDGGGLYLFPLFDDIGPTLRENRIVSNIAHQDGGGLYLGKYYSPFALTNNFVVNNEASRHGDQLFVDTEWPTLVARLQHNTFAHATLGGEAVYVGDHVTLYMTNTIIASHTVGIIEAGSDSAVDANYTFFANTGTNYQGNVVSTNEVTGVLAFAEPSAGDYHLTLLSEAIDAGIDAGVDNDIDNDPRPYGAGFDIGADEAIRIGVKLGPDHTQKIEPGTACTYLHVLTNTGLLSETFALSLGSTQNWAHLVTPSPIMLNPGMTETIVVQVTVPTDGVGLVDTAVITASSVLSPTIFDTAIDTTWAMKSIYLPLVFKN